MKDITKRLILLSCFALLLAALAVALPLLFKRGETKLSAAEPRVIVTPEPKTEEDSVRMRTPAPSPTQVITTPRPVYPQKAVNLQVNGTPLFAVGSREVAEQLVSLYLEGCANENLGEGAILLTASVDAELSTVAADGTVEYLEFDVAMNKLRKNRSLIPVRCTVERVYAERETPGLQVEYTSLLPKGSRMFRRCGLDARTLVFTETTYKDGLAVSETETLRTPVQTGVTRYELLGNYRLPSDAAPDDSGMIRNEGARGPAPSALSFVSPLRGQLVRCFGMQSGEMCYGVEYAAAPGTRVLAPESGTVIFLGERPGCGYIIEIRHDGGFISRLCFGANANTYNLVLERHVTKGETIALLPSVEGKPESILHYELLIDGIPYNPLYYLPEQ